MIFNCEFFYLEKQIPEEKLTESLSDLLGDTVLSYDDVDVEESYFGSIICDYYDQGFATLVKLMTNRESPNPLSKEDIAQSLAKQFQTNVVTGLPDDHRYADIPICWQMFDKDGVRYYVEEENKGVDLDTWDDETDDDDIPFIIVLQQPWPGAVTNEEDDDDET